MFNVQYFCMTFIVEVYGNIKRRKSCTSNSPQTEVNIMGIECVGSVGVCY